jgi:hypothetical protein
MNAGQLNGKSSNLNHAVLEKIYPHTRCAADVPSKVCSHVILPAGGGFTASRDETCAGRAHAVRRAAELRMAGALCSG